MRGERFWFLLAAGLYALGLWDATHELGWHALRWTRYPLFLPTGLLSLCLLNHWVRSKVVGWGVFSLGFACLIVILGALAVQARAAPGTPWPAFLRALGMYAALAMTGLYQLRPRPRPDHGQRRR